MEPPGGTSSTHTEKLLSAFCLKNLPTPPLVTNTHCTDNVQPRGGVITSESLCVVLETVLSAAGESVQSEGKKNQP